jgi:hypothetical protein
MDSSYTFESQNKNWQAADFFGFKPFQKKAKFHSKLMEILVVLPVLLRTFLVAL